MKYSLYGFVTIADLIDNAANIDSPLGELSDEVRTYALDKGYYSDPTTPDVRLIAFRSKEDEERDIIVPPLVRDICIRLGEWSFNSALNGVITSNPHVTKQAIRAEFNTEIKDIKIGKMVECKGAYLPQYVEFYLVNEETYESAKIKLWFSDPALKAQYPFWEVVPVPLVDNIDDFFTTYQGAKFIKDHISLKEHHERANVVRGKSPYTLIATYEYYWYDKNDENNRVLIPWTVIIYGPIANNIDIIRDALCKWILEHSEHDRGEWEEIFPDLFTPTEFVFAPLWTLPSVPGYRTVDAMYSPTLPYVKLPTFAKNAMYGYNEEYLQENLEVTQTLYKSLAMVVAGNPKNRLMPTSFYNAFPQYALIRSRTDDFNRIDERHQNFYQILNELLVAAEGVTDESTLPTTGIAKVVRGDILYVTKYFENVQYLMVAKFNYGETGKLEPIKPNPNSMLDRNYDS